MCIRVAPVGLCCSQVYGRVQKFYSTSFLFDFVGVHHEMHRWRNCSIYWGFIHPQRRMKLWHLQDNREGWEIIMLSEINSIQKEKCWTFPSCMQPVFNSYEWLFVKKEANAWRGNEWIWSQDMMHLNASATVNPVCNECMLINFIDTLKHVLMKWLKITANCIWSR